MKNWFQRTLIAATVFTVVACGGGGDSGGSVSTQQATPTSFWTLGSAKFANGDSSVQQSRLIEGQKFTTVVASTARSDGAADTSNGAYSGSVVSVVLFDSGPGVYTIRASASDIDTTLPTFKQAVVSVTVGTTAGKTTAYSATAGQVAVTVDTGGKYHLSSVGQIAVAKGVDVSGGVAGAPPVEAMTLVDVQ